MKGRLTVAGVFILFIAAQPAFAAKAVAVIKGTAPDSKISGEATFTEGNGGLDVEVKVANVPPGRHGFHIHETGDCSDTGKAAGGHYNPNNVEHGLVTKNGFMHAHAGDFGNIEVAADGTGTLKAFIPNLTLIAGQYNVAGRAVILHEKEDDFGQPTGNAGGRIGCGTIGVVLTGAESVPTVIGEIPAKAEEAKDAAAVTIDKALNQVPATSVVDAGAGKAAGAEEKK